MLDWLIKMEDGVTKRKSSLENQTKTNVFWSHPRKSDKHILEMGVKVSLAKFF